MADKDVNQITVLDYNSMCNRVSIPSGTIVQNDKVRMRLQVIDTNGNPKFDMTVGERFNQYEPDPAYEVLAVAELNFNKGLKV